MLRGELGLRFGAGKTITGVRSESEIAWSGVCGAVLRLMRSVGHQGVEVAECARTRGAGPEPAPATSSEPVPIVVAGLDIGLQPALVQSLRPRQIEANGVAGSARLWR